MNGAFRQSMAWVHTWTGLLVGWAIFTILVTGALSVFDLEITEWMKAPTGGFLAHLFDANPDGEAARAMERRSRGGEHFVRLHFSFHADMAGVWIVGFITVAFLAVLTTGVITHARLLRDFFTFRPDKGLRSWLDAHLVLGVMTLPFLVMIAYTGLILFHVTYMPAGVVVHYRDYLSGYEEVVYGPSRPAEAAPPPQPVAPRWPALTDHPPLYAPAPERPESIARATRQAMVALHFADFGGPTVKWLYFLSGLASAAGLAAGLHAFTVKRASRQNTGPWSRALIGVVKRINCGVVAGLCVASVAYFWINRLLPAELGIARLDLEVWLFCTVWAAALLHAFARPAIKAWREQFLTAAALCAGLPLLNAATSSVSLHRTLLQGHWRLATVDIAALGFAAIFAGIAWRLRSAAAAERHGSLAGSAVHAA